MEHLEQGSGEHLEESPSVGVTIKWRCAVEVPENYRDATKQTVSSWIRRRWTSWTDGKVYKKGMNVDAGGLPRILIGVRVRFDHKEGEPPTATVKQCTQVALEYDYEIETDENVGRSSEGSEQPVIIEPNCSYQLQAQVDNNVYVDVRIGIPIDQYTPLPPVRIGNLIGGGPSRYVWPTELLLIPLDQGVGIFPYWDTVPWGEDQRWGWALAENASWLGIVMTGVVPFSIPASEYSLIDAGEGTFQIRALATDALLQVYPGAGPWNEDDYFISSSGFRIKPAGATFRFKPDSKPTPRGALPTVAGPLRQPLQPPPKITSVDQDLPDRVPANASDDPVYGEVAIPFFLVQEDELNVTEQMFRNTYYRLRHTRYFKLLGSYRKYGGPQENRVITVTTGMTETDSVSITKTLSLTVMADTGFQFEELSGSLQTTIESQLVVEQTHTVEKMATKEVQREYLFTDGESGVIAYYGLVHAYDLYRADGYLVRRWEVVDPDNVYENEYKNGGSSSE